jgi:hypothetical protein
MLMGSELHQEKQTSEAEGAHPKQRQSKDEIFKDQDAKDTFRKTNRTFS